MKILKATHLTAHDRKLIKASLDNNLQDVSTPKKRLNIICQNAEGTVKANLWTFAVGIGIGSKSQWRKKEIQFCK